MLCIFSETSGELIHGTSNQRWKEFISKVPSELIQNNALLHVNAREDIKMYVGKHGTYGDRVEIMVINEIYSIS
jgi:hypothetical protein